MQEKDIYLNAGKEMSDKGELEFEGNYTTLELSLKVLDLIAENSEKLPVAVANLILTDAIKILPQILGIN